MNTKTLFALVFTLWSSLGFGQDLTRKNASISRVQQAPKIDGQLDDEIWSQLTPLEDFVMFQPGNGEAERETHRTVLYVGYDNDAFYVGARMYDPNPDSILTQLTERDDRNANADWLGVFINPFNDGLNDFNFWITAAGVQIDSRTTSEGDDRGWNTVWSSAVSITEDGWVAELKIPYRCLRFPKAQGSTWGFKLMIIPGAMALWPLMLKRWISKSSAPPEEKNAHRIAACKLQQLKSSGGAS